MLLSPPSPPSAHRFSPRPPEPKVSQSSRSPLSAISVPSNSYPSIEDYSYSPTSVSSVPRSDLSPKTSAFFGSPFVSPSQSPSSSQSASYLSKTAAFFSSPFSDSSSSPPSEERTPRDLTSSRSLTADFFTTAAFSSCPTSPPSLRSSTSNASLRTSASHTSSSCDHHLTPPPEQSQEAEATPVPKPQVPLLSRLFPSRYSSNLRRTVDNRLPSQRGFVTIEAPDDVFVSPPTTIEDPHIPDVSAAAAAAGTTPISSVCTSGTLLHPDNESEPSYELVRRIGHGSFSHVWLARMARSQGLQALTAVKMIARVGEHRDPVARRTARGERASFLREVEVLHVRTLQPVRTPTLTLLPST
jgi:hypothetical protein